MKLLRPLAVTAAVVLAAVALTIVLLGEKLNGLVAASVDQTLEESTGCEVRVGPPPSAGSSSGPSGRRR